MSINLLVNGDQLNTTLNSTGPLYQTFKKGTNDFTPNWQTMSDALRPIVFPRIFSVMEGKTLIPTDVSWKYNDVQMTFDAGGIATAPSIVAGKIQEVTYNGAKALKMIGNVASDANNDSDTISFSGRVNSSGQSVLVSADITVLVEEGTNNLYRLFLMMQDDVLDPGESSLSMKAMLYNNGALVSTNVQYEFLKFDATVLRAKDPSDTLSITPEMVNGELMVVCKAYVGTTMVVQEQKQVWDVTDPYVVVCDQGNNLRQRAIDDVTYTFTLLNARTGVEHPGAVFVIKVYNNATLADISAEFNPQSPSITISGAKIQQHKSILLEAQTTITL
ncbi:MAG: hypothetical protein AAGU18_10700 [Proteiniphilum sp.]